jgi:hypothetical protein
MISGEVEENGVPDQSPSHRSTVRPAASISDARRSCDGKAIFDCDE